MTSPTVPVVAAYPYYPDNPWQDLCYAGLGAHGATMVPVGSLAGLDEIVVACGGVPVALHVNWTTPVAQVVPDVSEAFQQVEAVLATLADCRAAGVRIVWTVHNVLPHELHHVTPELLLHRGLARLADVVHVMNPRTPHLVRPFYELPEGRVVNVPHPSYLGRYEPLPKTVHDGVRLLLFGSLRPYKGVLEFADEVVRARSAGTDVRLLVAGRVSGGWTEEHLRTELERHGDTLELRPGHVDDADLAALFADADALALPYEAGLNSGAAMLAATFSTPVLLGAGLRHSVLLDPTWQVPLWGCDETAGGLGRALTRLGHEAASLQQGAARAAQRVHPDDVARAMARVLLGERA